MKRTSNLIKLMPVYAAVLVFFLLIGVGGNRAVSVISESSPLQDRKTVVIDAGHGGVDGGATSCTGVLESNINLEIAMKLKDLLRLLGIKTIMIRESDISVYTQGDTIASKKVSDLKERVHIINDSGCQIVISIHQNYFQDQRYFGPQVFYAPTDDSTPIARNLQLQLNEFFYPNSRRTAKAASGVYLMQHITCPGILVECGFISNPQEEAALRDSTYQQKFCCVLAANCSKYLFSKPSA